MTHPKPVLNLLLGGLVGLLVAAPAFAEPGRLVIVGGALNERNAEIWGAFVHGLPHPATDRVAIIAAASGEPVASFESARAALALHGVSPDRVVLVRAAIIDDPATSNDESLWADEGDGRLVHRLLEAAEVSEGQVHAPYPAMAVYEREITNAGNGTENRQPSQEDPPVRDAQQHHQRSVRPRLTPFVGVRRGTR